MDSNRFLSISQNRKSVIIAISLILLFLLSIKAIIVPVEKDMAGGIRTDGIDIIVLERSLEDYHITESEANDIKSLEIEECGVVYDLNWLGYFKNIERITIKEASICSLSGIERASHLKSMAIYDSSIDDMSSLRDLQINDLVVSRCVIGETMDVGKMYNLTLLKVTDCGLKSIRGLYPELVSMDLRENNISNLNDVDIPKTVEELRLDGNPLESIEPLAQMSKINKLGIQDTMVKDLSAVKKMKSINAIYIDSEEMDDSLDYLYKNFRNGDKDRKRQYLSEKYQLGD